MILKTKRLTLRHWENGDVNNLYQYAKDPDIGPIAGWPAHKSIEESSYILNNILNGKEAYAICLKSDGNVIGAIELKLNGHTDFTERNDECELGYWLGKPFWGQGIMPEAVNEILRHAFEDIGMTKVWVGYYEGNLKSKRVQEKVHFRYQWKSDDVDVPLMNEKRTGYVSSLTKEQWQWDRLYMAAKTAQNSRKMSAYEEKGGVATAILSAAGNIFTGVSDDTYSTLGICAERNAVFNMLCNGDQEIAKVITILPNGKNRSPCGACREMIIQLMPEKYKSVGIMLDYDQEKVKTLGDLMPQCWI